MIYSFLEGGSPLGYCLSLKPTKCGDSTREKRGAKYHGFSSLCAWMSQGVLAFLYSKKIKEMWEYTPPPVLITPKIPWHRLPFSPAGGNIDVP